MEFIFDLDYLENREKLEEKKKDIKIKKQFIKRSKKWNYLFNYYDQNYNINPDILLHYSNIINNNSYIFKKSYQKIENPYKFFKSIEKKLKKQKIIVFFKKTLGKKFKNLFNELVLKYMEKIKTSEAFYSELKKTIRNNIYKYDNFVFLMNDIQHIYNNINNWNFSFFKNKIDKKNIVYFEDNVLIFKTLSFDEHKKFASKLWCTNDIFDYNNYIPEGVLQFIKYDFNRTFNDKSSIIGFTYDKKIIHCFDNLNKPCRIDKKLLEKII